MDIWVGATVREGVSFIARKIEEENFPGRVNLAEGSLRMVGSSFFARKTTYASGLLPCCYSTRVLPIPQIEGRIGLNETVEELGIVIVTYSPM